jgi:hypothetical protein
MGVSGGREAALICSAVRSDNDGDGSMFEFSKVFSSGFQRKVWAEFFAH